MWLRVLEEMDEYGGEASRHPSRDVKQKDRQESNKLLEQCRLRPHPSLTDAPSPLL